MAVLIETAWSLPGADRGNARVVSAILPSGKVLTVDDDEAPQGAARADLERAIRVRREDLQEQGSFSEDELFEYISLEFGGMWGRFELIDDPKEAREVIKEAKLTATVTPRERTEYRSDDELPE